MGFNLAWDQAGQRKYETGVDRGVLYVQNTDGTYQNGVAWNGLTGVTETPSGAEETKLYADNMKYLSLRSAEEFGGTIEAYTYPDEWQACDGSKSITTGVVAGQQSRSAFGFSYRTAVGNDTALSDYGYKLHIVYGATVSPSERAYATINDSPEAITFSWAFTTTPIEIPASVGDFKPTAIITIDTTELDGGKENAKLVALEKILYGDTTATADVYTKLANDAKYDSSATYYVVDATTASGYDSDSTVTSSNFSEKKSTLYTKSTVTGTSAKLPSPKEIYELFTAA